MVLSACGQDWLELGLQAAMYALWVMELRRVSHQIGSFRASVVVSYPIPLAVFLWVFLWSWIKKTLNIPVYWKGREIRRGR